MDFVQKFLVSAWSILSSPPGDPESKSKVCMYICNVMYILHSKVRASTSRSSSFLVFFFLMKRKAETSGDWEGGEVECEFK
jgi:hypothetical protein